MCLTIPAKVTKIENGYALIGDTDPTKKVGVGFFPDLKVGDWILYAMDTAVRKISKKDAKEIIDLLETRHPLADPDKLSEKYKKIIKNSKLRDLKKDEIVYLLKTEDVEKEALFAEADVIRKTYLKDFICIHGIIEFSNYCKNDCAYCGLRCGNSGITRYRMSVDEIVQVASDAVHKKGYKLLVLQSGEDLAYSDKMLVEIIRKIKSDCKVFIFMSVGERGYDCYKKMKEAGASGVLFRFETSSSKLFKKFHSAGKNFKSRFEHLKFMRELGYYIATGSLIGLPGQTIEDLADDVLMMKKWANMISMGPYVPMSDTPLSGEPSGDPEMNFKMIAVLRLLMKYARIPVVTALETLAGDDGRKRALLAGANSLMFNVTPEKYRPYYKIYDNRYFKEENMWEEYGLFKAEESYKMIEDRMGRELEENK